MTNTPRTRFLLALAAVATIAATAGCSGSGSSDSSRTTSSRDDGGASVVEEPAADGDMSLEDRGDAAAFDVGAPAPDKQADKSGDLDAPAVISTGTVSLESTDVGEARFEVRKIVDKFRGTVTEQETTTGDEGEVTTARLVLRVPSARFSEVTAELEEVATLTGSTSAGQDVSTEVVDVEARIRAQSKSVARIEALLARAENLQQIVTIESQLSSRQAELDALLSRQTYLKDQTSQSTITVYIEQPDERSDDPDDDTDDGFLGGLSDGWDSFVTGFGAVLTVVGFLVPWLVLLLLIGIPTRLLLKRRGGATT